MKTKFTLVLTIALGIFSSNAQTTQLNEGFTATFNPGAAGWFVQNNSAPTGTTTWHQGQSAVFSSYNGGVNDYFAADFNSQGATAGGISNFLITPTVTLVNGGVLKFATRTVDTPTYPDRIQILYSNGVGTGAIGAGTTAIGTFTSLGYINGGLTTAGYPNVWTVYGVTLSAVAGSGPGRFAFRYFVENSGANGANGEYIGIDDVQYTIPSCNPPAVSINPTSPIVCGGGSVLLTAGGASNYTWSTGSNAGQISVSPTSNTIYTLTGSSAPGCFGTTTVQVSVVSAPVVVATSASVCSAGPVVLTASGASTYLWSTGGTSPSITVSPSSNTTYTVTGSIGTCTGVTTASVIFVSPPNVSVSNATACPGANVTLNASGASTYLWSNGATGSSIVVSSPNTFTMSVTGSNGSNCSNTQTLAVNVNTFLTAPSVTACPNLPVALVANGGLIYNWNTGATTSSIIITPTANTSYTVTGSNGVCSETKIILVNIDPNVTTTNFTTCAGTAATLIATGATSYTWSNGSFSSFIVVTPTANTVYTVTGGNGTCSQTKTVSVTIGTSLSVGASAVCVSSQIILTASGASTYTWLPTGQNSASIIFTPTSATVYTLTGSSGTCMGTTTVLVAYCIGVEENTLLNSSMVVYPNPFTNELNISGAYGDVQVINGLGQVILTTTVSESTIINTDTFTTGLYFIRVTNAKTNEKKIIRVIKN